MLKLKYWRKYPKKTINELNKFINNEYEKPKFWDYKKLNIYAYILYPITFLIKITNFFKIKLKLVNKKPKIKTICIGNIYVGGTGKTSLSLKINQIFKEKINSCFIKKFYSTQIDEQNY